MKAEVSGGVLDCPLLACSIASVSAAVCGMSSKGIALQVESTLLVEQHYQRGVVAMSLHKQSERWRCPPGLSEKCTSFFASLAIMSCNMWQAVILQLGHQCELDVALVALVRFIFNPDRQSRAVSFTWARSKAGDLSGE